MKIKAIRGIANSLSQMCVSHRIDTSLERLADLPDGTVEVDLLKRTCCRSGSGTLELPIVEQFAAWLLTRMEHAGLSLESLEQATIILNYSNRVPTDRSRILLFDLECTSQLGIEGRVVEGHAKSGVWYHRLSNTPLQPTSGA